MTAKDRREIRKRLKGERARAIARASTMCQLEATSRAFAAALRAIRGLSRHRPRKGD